MISRVSSAAQCRALDALAIGEWGVPGVALMELASSAVALSIQARFPDRLGDVLVVCGGGNNGGDGYAIARWLHREGIPVRIWSLSSSSGGDAAIMRAAAEKMRIPSTEVVGEPSLIVDAVFGTGLDRPIQGGMAEILDHLAAYACPCVAVDLPSGLHPDTGAVLGTVLPAVHTVTFGRWKPAFFTRGAIHAGTVEVVDIGLPPDGHSTARLVTAKALSWPIREVGVHKNRLGHLAVIAGSREMAGAAVLACQGALAAGVGLVTLFTPEAAIPRLGRLSPAVMLRPMPLEDALGAVEGFDAVAVGPGVDGGRGISLRAREGLSELWSAPGAVVFDAGALVPLVGEPGGTVVRTPHPGEAARLLGTTSAEVEADRFGAIEALGALGGTVVLKGRHSLIRGEQLWVNTRGAPTLATAGSGDVLTGVIGALLARGLSGERAARTAVWVHGRAGELLAEARRDGWTAEDVAARVPVAAGELDVAG